MSNTFWSRNHINFAALEDEYNSNVNQQHQHQQQHQQVFTYPSQQEQYGYQQLASSSLQDAFGFNQPVTHSSSFRAQSTLSGYLSSQQAPPLSSGPSTGGPSSSYPLNHDAGSTHEQLASSFASPPSSSALPVLDTNFASLPSGSSPTRFKRPRELNDHSAEHAAADPKGGKAKLYVIYSLNPISC
jgi:hypothetical protein